MSDQETVEAVVEVPLREGSEISYHRHISAQTRCALKLPENSGCEGFTRAAVPVDIQLLANRALPIQI